MSTRAAIICLYSIVAAVPVGAQSAMDTSNTTLPVGRGQLNLEAATLRLNSGNLEIVFIPLDARILRLLAPDANRSMQRLVAQNRTAIDSINTANGITQPGLALVSFHGLAPNTRFDPSLVTVSFHGQQYHAVGWIPMSASFSNQRLNLRDQVQALFVFSRDLPVLEAFTLSYLGGVNDEWQRRLPRFDAERTRILGLARTTADTGR